jgi:hypothetical protein
MKAKRARRIVTRLEWNALYEIITPAMRVALCRVGELQRRLRLEDARAPKVRVLR